MSEIKVSVNGVITGADQAVVPVLDRGFLYGDSVFEVYRTYDGRPFCERPHLQRLARSAERLLIKMPISEDALAAEVRALLDVAALPNAYLRIMICLLYTSDAADEN